MSLLELPDEMILKEFSSLDLEDLLNCAKTSKRLRNISQDFTLWSSLNLYFATIPCELIEYIMDKVRCKHLSLMSAQLLGSVMTVVEF